MSADEPKDFERTLGNEDRLRIQQTHAADDAFIAAMKDAIKAGKETVSFGVRANHDAPAAPLRMIRGEPPFSSCGSPAQSCAERGESGVNGVGEVRYA